MNSWTIGFDRVFLDATIPNDLGKIRGLKMGGFRSGNRYRPCVKKMTVEESLAVTAQQFVRRFHSNSHGKITWIWTPLNFASLEFEVRWDFGKPVVILDYRCRNGDDMRLAIEFQNTPTQFGGLRWWFKCPVSVGGRACQRRSGNLYLPPGACYFACRKCHGLTYESCQMSHQTERMIARCDSFERWMAKWDDRKKPRVYKS